MESPKDQYACSRICVEVDLEAGLPEAIKLTVGNWYHYQKLDYEQLPFKCRGCHEYEHFLRNCPQKQDSQQEKEDGWKAVKKIKSKNGHQHPGNKKASKKTPLEALEETSSGPLVIEEDSNIGEMKETNKEAGPTCPPKISEPGQERVKEVGNQENSEEETATDEEEEEEG